MRRMGGRAWILAGAATAVLCAAMLSPCMAGQSLPTPGGGVLAVEAVAADGRTPAADGRAIMWSWTDGANVRNGIVPSTAGPEPDASPVLATDPRTGAPVLLWSHWDGQAMKLAWSRFDAGSWSPERDVTFGPGNDGAPAVGVSAAGAYLFFWRDGRRVLYAPIDLGTGRLFAAPRPLSSVVLKGRDATPNGGNDVPIIGTCGPHHNAPCSVQSPPLSPSGPGSSGPSPEGGTDTPIISSGGSSSAADLSVASQPACQTMLVGLARRGESVLRMVAFDGAGRAWLMGSIPTDGVPAAALAASTSRYFEAVCH